MSRGPGRVERAILDIFNSAPGDAYTVEDLADRVFPGVNRLEKKHRVSVIRAAKKACERAPGWTWSAAEGLGSSLIFWMRYNVLSYASMRAKGDMFSRYRSNDTRCASSSIATPESIRAKIGPGGRYHHHVQEGGAWWRHVQLWIAERDGDDSSEVQRLKEEVAAERAAFWGKKA